MTSDARDIGSAEDARIAVLAERFEMSEVEIEPGSESHIKEARGELYDALWQLFMEDRQEVELEGISVREDVVVAFETDEGQFLGVLMTLPGVVAADDFEELTEHVRAFAEQENGVDGERVQVTVRLVRPESVEATLIRVLLLL